METTKFRSLFPSIATSGPLSESSLDHFFSDALTFMSPEFSTKGHKVQNNETGSIIEIPLPGAGKDDVSISVKESDKLIVEVNKDTKYSGGQIYKFKLLSESDTEGIEAEMKNGLLVLNVPKKKSFQNKFIKIK